MQRLILDHSAHLYCLINSQRRCLASKLFWGSWTLCSRCPCDHLVCSSIPSISTSAQLTAFTVSIHLLALIRVDPGMQECLDYSFACMACVS